MTVIKNIIFDFGGVIYNIDFSRSIKAFQEIGISHFEELYTQAFQDHLFERLETDLISPAEFRDEIRKIANINLKDIEIDQAWNALLIGFEKKRLDLLQKLKKNYRIYLFSNTNRIHYHCFLKQFQELTNYESFDGLFVKSFFSFDIKNRKPNLDAYKYLISDLKIKPDETLFIDDSIQNIKPAIELGIKGWHLSKEFGNLFEDNLLRQEVIKQLG